MLYYLANNDKGKSLYLFTTVCFQISTEELIKSENARPIDREDWLYYFFSTNEITVFSWGYNSVLHARPCIPSLALLQKKNQPTNQTKNPTALFICYRSEQKIWSPLVTEEGKRHPYKMNLASEPQVSTCSALSLLPPATSHLWHYSAYSCFSCPGSLGRKCQGEPSTVTAGIWLFCSVLPIRELSEKRAGKPQGRDLSLGWKQE
jgi:hypothetical protein